MFVKRGFRVIQHDVRGVGQSVAAARDVAGSEQFTFDQFGLDACKLLDHLGIKQAYILGMAWGSRAAFVMGSQHPERVLGVALYDFSIGNSLVPEWSFAQKIGTTLAKQKLNMAGHAEQPQAAWTHANKKMSAMAMHATSKAPYGSADTFTASMNLSGLDVAAVPILIATGEFDPNLVATPGGSVETLALLRGLGLDVTLSVMDSAGHVSFNHNARVCVDVFCAWVAGTKLNASPVGEVDTNDDARCKL